MNSSFGSKDFAFHMGSLDDPSKIMAMIEASALNNQALQEFSARNYGAAERLHLDALRLKQDSFGEESVTTALTRNGLGELYLEMGRLNEAESQFKKALAFRCQNGPVVDAAVTRDNLGGVEEARGDLVKARMMRLGNDPASMVCSSRACARADTSKISDLSQCARCKAAFYCSSACQTADWKARHKKFCKGVA
ncbi:hypothetical protein ONZ45_g15097 [Pleurotus djamor]|nr:hypothetical protein ONZ45_g15097 [Pleurotus djamor]